MATHSRPFRPPHIPNPDPVEEAEEASELYLALMSLPRPSREIDIPKKLPPGFPSKVAIWPITQEEQNLCNARADIYARELLKNPQKRDDVNLGYQHIYQNEVACQVLALACRDVKNVSRPAFPSPKQLRALFTTDEQGVLFNEYCHVQVELGPIVAYMTKEEMEGLILRIHKGGSNYPFASLSWEEQSTFLSFLVSQVVSSWMDTSSAGWQPDVTPNTQAAIQELLVEERERLAATEQKPSTPEISDSEATQESAPEPSATE